MAEHRQYRKMDGRTPHQMLYSVEYASYSQGKICMLYPKVLKAILGKTSVHRKTRGTSEDKDAVG
jgi:hypothetical protein